MGSHWAAPFVAIVILFTGCSVSSSPPIAISLTPSSPQAIDQGVSTQISITAAVTNDNSGQGVTWRISGPGSLRTTPTSAAYVPPTAIIKTPQQISVTATAAADTTKSASVQITLNPYPSIHAQGLLSGTVGAPYSQPIPPTGGTAPFQWSIYNGPILTGASLGGSIPNGLTLNPTTGVISGTPTAAGTWYFEATLTDSDGATATDGLVSIQINPAADTTITNAVPFLNQPLVPTAVTPGGGGLTLKVSGAGFVSGANIDFNGAPLATTFIDNEHLSAVVPAANVATAGTAAVTVVNPAPGGGVSNIAYFSIASPEATITFANAPDSPLSIGLPDGLATADFNQDGKPDLAIAGGVNVSMMLSNGNGTFTPASGSPVPIPSPPYEDFASPYVGSLLVGDFTHSGHPGLAVAEYQNEAAVIFSGNGSGSLTPSSASFALSSGEGISWLAAADFNGDGNLDLSLINALGYPSYVALGYGAGAFNKAGALFKQGSFAGTAVIGDFNGDGKLDVALASGGSATYPGSGVAISLGNGDGTFTLSASPAISLGQDLYAITAGDFNGDGKLDLAATDSTENLVFILPGNGDGTFQPAVSFPTGSEPTAILTADFNNDGYLDLAIANSGAGTITLLLGDGAGNFTPAFGAPYLVGKAPDAIAAADFNGDGKLDLAVANGQDGTGTVSILLQQ